MYGSHHFVVLQAGTNGMAANVITFDWDQSEPRFIYYWMGQESVGSLDVDEGNLRPGGPNLTFVTSVIMDVNNLTLWIVNPQLHKTTRLFEEEEGRHGQVYFADLAGLGERQIIATISLNDQRYGNCEQCASRRTTFIYSYDDSTGSLRLRSVHTSWGDLGFGSNGGLFGMGPNVVANQNESLVESGINQLSSKEELDEDSLSDIEGLLESLAALIGGGDNRTGARLGAELLMQLRRFPDPPVVAKNIVGCSLLEAQALLAIGDFAGAKTLLGTVGLTGLDRRYLDVALRLKFDLARKQGSVRDEFDVLSAARRSAATATYGSLKSMYFQEVGRFEDAIQAAIEAADDDASNDESQSEAMLQQAVALARLADFESSVAVLTVLRRDLIDGSSLDSGLYSRATLTTADVALQAGYSDAARYLLDEAVANMTSEVWAEQGPSALLLYGRVSRAAGDKMGAEIFLKAAARLLPTGVNAVASTIRGELAALYEEEGRIPECLEQSRLSFNGVVGEQTTIAVERDKLSFIESADQIARDHLRRILHYKPNAADLVDILEKWRAQVLQSMSRTRMQLPSKKQPAEIVEELTRTKGRAYVTYYFDEDNSIALISELGSLRVVRLGLTLERLNELHSTIDKWFNLNDFQAQAFIRADRVPPKLEEALLSLYKDLIEPLSLDGTTEDVLVVPAEALDWIPWAAISIPAVSVSDSFQHLLGREHLHSILERMMIEVVPSITLYDGAPPERAKISYLSVGSGASVSISALMDALPDMTIGTFSKGLPGLRLAISEASDVDALLHPHMTGELLTDEKSPDLSAGRVLSMASSVSILHIAAHGIYDGVNPMASAIFLSDSVPAGVLRPSDFAAVDLSKVAVVVLSGCETGRSQFVASDEAMGFARGVFLSGAQKLILTKWSVDDAATRDFFDRFYKPIGDGESFSKAFRSTVFEMASMYAHPFYWGGMDFFSRSAD